MLELPKIKVTVPAVTGGNGWETFVRVAKLPFVQAVGLVRKPDDIARISGNWRDFDQREFEHFHYEPIITDDPERCRNSHIWFYWKGLSLSKLEKTFPNLEAMAIERGLHRRDLLLEHNLRIFIEDYRLKMKYAPGAAYIIGGNPVDVFIRLGVKMGHPANLIFSAGETLGSFRLNEIFNEEIPGSGQSKNNMPVFGEHGESAAVIKSRVFIGGVRPIELLRSLNVSEPNEVLRRIYSRLNTEAFEISMATGETPHFAPGSIAADLAKMMLSGNPVCSTASVYVEHSKHYGLEDVALTLPVSIDHTGIRYICNVDLPIEEMRTLRKSAEHIKRVNSIADELLKEIA